MSAAARSIACLALLLGMPVACTSDSDRRRAEPSSTRPTVTAAPSPSESPYDFYDYDRFEGAVVLPLSRRDFYSLGHINALQHTRGGVWVGIGRSVVNVSIDMTVGRRIDLDYPVRATDLSPNGTGMVVMRKGLRTWGVWINRGKPALPFRIARAFGPTVHADLVRRGEMAWVALSEGGTARDVVGTKRGVGVVRRFATPPGRYREAELVDAGDTFAVSRTDGLLEYRDWSSGSLIRQQDLGQELDSVTRGFGSLWGYDQDGSLRQVPLAAGALIRPKEHAHSPATMSKRGIVVRSNVDNGYPVPPSARRSERWSVTRYWVLSPKDLSVIKRFAVGIFPTQDYGHLISGRESSNILWMDLGGYLARVDLRDAWTFEPNRNARS